MKRNNEQEDTSSKKPKIEKPLSILSRGYDPFVLGYVFKFCSPQDLPNLAVINREWNSTYFSKENILVIWEEWINTRWNKICGSKTYLSWEWSVGKLENECLAYWPRLLKVLTNSNQNMVDDLAAEGDEDPEADFELASSDDSDQDELDEDEYDDPLYKISVRASSHAEFIEIDSVKLCKITQDNYFYLISQRYGDIILIKKKEGMMYCMFYGNLLYPSINHCSYRSNFWVKISPLLHGVCAIQLKYISYYLNLDDNHYSIVCTYLPSIIGLEENISRSTFNDCFGRNVRGLIHLIPWQMAKLLLTDTEMVAIYCSSEYNSGIDMYDILDDRFFSDFELFSKLVSVSTEITKEISWKKLALRVEQHILKNREILPFITNRKVFKILDKSLRHDMEFVNEVLKKDPETLKYLFNEEYKDLTIKKETIMDCLKRGFKLTDLPTSVKISNDLLQSAIKYGKLEYIPEELRKNSLEVIIGILKHNPYADLFIERDYISNKKIALEVIKYAPEALRYINNDVLQKYPEIQEEAVKNWYRAFDFCRTNMDYLKEIAFQSLTELFNLPHKKIKVVYEFNTVRKEKEIIELEKKFQPIFLVSSKPTENFRLYFGPHIQEKGYQAKIHIQLQDVDETSLKSIKKNKLDLELRLLLNGVKFSMFSKKIESLLL